MTFSSDVKKESEKYSTNLLTGSIVMRYILHTLKNTARKQLNTTPGDTMITSTPTIATAADFLQINALERLVGIVSEATEQHRGDEPARTVKSHRDLSRDEIDYAAAMNMFECACHSFKQILHNHKNDISVESIFKPWTDEEDSTPSLSDVQHAAHSVVCKARSIGSSVRIQP